MNDVKRIGLPFLVILVSAFVTRFVASYVTGDNAATIIKVVSVIGLCAFGATLHTVIKKRSGSVWKKVVAILVIIFLLFMQLGYFTFASVNDFFLLFGVDAFYMNMLYILCGYMLMD